jgi:hypothetical protein
MKRVVRPLLLCLALSALRPAPACADTQGKELLRQASKIVQILQDRQCKNVGVLKFLIARAGGGEPSLLDNVGPLNLTLARRLEIALALANPLDPAKQLGLLRDASTRAAQLDGADHRTAAGRKALFAADYPLQWGKAEVRPDAFVTGVARLSTDLKELRVTVEAVFKDRPEVDQLFQFSLDHSPAALSDSGESGLFRGADPTKPLDPLGALKAAALVRAGKALHPFADPAAPVTLDLLYGGKPVKMKIGGGQAQAPEPRAGQKVQLVLRRQDDRKERYAAVLKVNGVNTLFKQRHLPEPLCAKWVLEPGVAAVTVDGFYVQDAATKKLLCEEFRGLSAAASKQGVLDYGADVGLISLAVFRPRRGDPPPPSLDDDADLVQAVERGLLPERRPKSLAALRAQLKAGVGRGDDSRGVIGGGVAKETGDALPEVEIEVDPVPVMVATVRYFRP